MMTMTKMSHVQKNLVRLLQSPQNTGSATQPHPFHECFDAHHAVAPRTPTTTMSAFGNAYSKWDHLEDSDDDNEAANEAAVAAEAANEAAAAEAAAAQAYAEAAYAADDKGGGGGGGDGAVRSSSSAAAANAAGGGGAEEEEETIATLPGMAKVDPATAAQMAAEDPEAARMLAEVSNDVVHKDWVS